MKLYELPRSKDGINIYGLKDTKEKDIIVKFYHIDGAYSYCVAYSKSGKELGVVHLSASTPIEKTKKPVSEFEYGWDGYKIIDEPHPST